MTSQEPGDGQNNPENQPAAGDSGEQREQQDTGSAESGEQQAASSSESDERLEPQAANSAELGESGEPQVADSAESAEPLEQQAAGSAESGESGERESSVESHEQDPHADVASESEQSESAEGSTAKKKKTGVIIGVVAAAVVVLGVVGGWAYAFSGKSAQSVAQDYVTLATKETQNPQSVTADDYRPLVCRKAMPQIEQMQQQKQMMLKNAQPAELDQIKQIRTTLKGVNTNGDSGEATIESTLPGQPPESAKVNLIKEDGDWKLCG